MLRFFATIFAIAFFGALAIVALAFALDKKKTAPSPKPKIDFATNPNFISSLEKAKEIKSFFSDVAKRHNGTLNIVKYNIDGIDSIDFEAEKQNPFIYFRLRLPRGYNADLALIKDLNNSLEARNICREKYLQEIYAMDSSGLSAIGIDPYDIVYDIIMGDDPLESILYYKYLCPCNLVGDDRDFFVRALN